MSKGRYDSRTASEKSEQRGLTRRSLLKSAAGAALGAAAAGVIGAKELRAQVSGLYTTNEPPQIALPMGALTYLDKKQYIHNMEIQAHLPGATISGGEPLCVMWARGKQRLLPAGGGFVDISDGKNPVVLNKGVTQGMGTVTYNTKIKKWIMMCTAAQPLTMETPQYPHGQYDKELRDKVLAYKGLRGIRNYDITDPKNPKMLQEYNTGVKGNGTHHNFYDGGQYAYLDCGWDDQLRLENLERPYSNALMIVDMSDPSNVKEVSRWWVPGQRLGEEAEYKKYRFAGDHTSWTGNHGAITRSEARRRRRQCRLRRFRRLRDVRDGFVRYQAPQALRPRAVRVRYLRHNPLPHLFANHRRWRPPSPRKILWSPRTKLSKPTAARTTTLPTWWT